MDENCVKMQLYCVSFGWMLRMMFWESHDITVCASLSKMFLFSSIPSLNSKSFCRKFLTKHLSHKNSCAINILSHMNSCVCLTNTLSVCLKPNFVNRIYFWMQYKDCFLSNISYHDFWLQIDLGIIVYLKINDTFFTNEIK